MSVSDHKWAPDDWRRAKNLVSGAMSRAKRKSLPFDLSVMDIANRIHRGFCEASGLPFSEKPAEYGPHHPFRPSLDQIVPGLGYLPTNVQVVCWIYNAAKGSGSHEDVLSLAEALHSSGAPPRPLQTP